jgi:hypothetical protein
MSGGVLLQIASKFDPKGIVDAKSGMDRLASAGKAFAAVSAVAFAAAAAGAVAFGVESLKAAAHSDAIGRSLEQMAKNSGVFGSTTEEVKKSTSQIMEYTKSLSNLTGIDDEILNSIVRGWMAVPEFAGKGVQGLEKMVQVVADVAAGTGKDVQSLGMAFIKVAGDETTALGKLLRQGIVFTDAQKQMYQSILDTSGEIAAQDYLIGELDKTYSGAGEAAANVFDVLSQNFRNFQEEIGKALLPAFETLIPKVREFLDGLVVNPEFQGFLKNIGDQLVSGFDALTNWLSDNGLKALQGILDVVNPTLEIFGTLFGFIAVNDAATPTANFASALEKVGGGLQFIADTLKNIQDVYDGLPDWVKGLLFDNPLGHLGDIMNYTNPFTGTTLGDFFTRLGTQAPSVPVAPRNNVFSGGLSPMATGGIVMGPTPALIGEAGPEAIIPLDRLGSMGQSVHVTVNTVAGDPAAIERVVLDAISRASRRGTTRLAV